MRIRLEDFDIDRERGFLPAPDLPVRLPAAFALWDEMAARLPLLIMTGRLRTALAAMPLVDAGHLECAGDLRRALVLLAGFANAWMVGEPVPQHIPKAIAVPLIDVSQRLGMPPISTHGTVALFNWKRIDATQPLSVDNIDTALTFRGSVDEKWFFLATVGVELEGATALPLVEAALQAADDNDSTRLTETLASLSAAINRVTAALTRIRESCDPYVFYHQVRPYLAGWPAEGVVYEGTGVGPISYSGASAAQSTLPQALDAALGITHAHALTSEFLASMRNFMPPLHRAFVEAVAQRSQIRARVLAIDTPTALRDAYDTCVNGLDVFRRKHMGIATDYITRQMPKGAVAVGTGGTSFEDFLRQARIETAQAMTARAT